jgi:hypothetical protein
LFQLEKNILETWGDELKVAPLRETDKYFVRNDITYMIGQKRVLLGRRPYQNLKELLRKFYCLFGEESLQQFEQFEEESFNQDYFVFCKRLGENIFHFKNSPNFNMTTFSDSCPKGLEKLFRIFRENINQDFTFKLLCQAYLQRKISRITSEFELFHIFLCLLSPFYQLEKDSFLDDLEFYFEKLGGKMAIGPVKSLEYRGGKIQRILFPDLGPLEIREVFLSRGGFNHFPFKITEHENIYTSGLVNWSFKEVPTGLPKTCNFVLTNKLRMGGSFPFSFIYISEKTLRAEILIPFESGAKIDLYREALTSLLRADLKMIWGEYWQPPISETLTMGEVPWFKSQERSLSLGKVEFRLPKKISIKGVSKSRKLFGPKNLHYFGNFRGETLGILSTLMEIKDQRPYK